MKPTMLVVLLAVAGCTSAPDGRVPVSGRVSLDGRPLADLALHLSPRGQTSGQGALGVTDADGAFAMADVRGPKGVFVGEYVLILDENGRTNLAKLTGAKAGTTVELPVAIPPGGCELTIQLHGQGQAPRVSIVKR